MEGVSLNPCSDVGASLVVIRYNANASCSQIRKKFATSVELYLAQNRDVTAHAQFSFDLGVASHFLSRGASLTDLLSTLLFIPIMDQSPMMSK